MRAIEFRGKRIDNGDWVEGDLVTNYLPIPRICVARESVAVQYLFEVNPKTIGEFTGLSDKDGKKIFEGDVLKIFYCPSGFEIGKVKWAYEKCRFVIVLQGDGFSYNFDDTLDCYIIGNIHDNPELLQEDKDAI